MVLLENERIVLESLDARHAEALLAYHDRNRAHLEPWEPARDPDFYELSYHRETIRISLANAAIGASERFVAVERATAQVVANVNLWNIRRGVVQAAVLGYSVDARAQGHGYATTCARAVVDHAFGTLGLHRIETSYNPINAASGRVLRKIGFSVEGYARDYLFIDGAWRDAILVGLVNPTSTILA